MNLLSTTRCAESQGTRYSKLASIYALFGLSCHLPVFASTLQTETPVVSVSPAADPQLKAQEKTGSNSVDTLILKLWLSGNHETEKTLQTFLNHNTPFTIKGTVIIKTDDEICKEACLQWKYLGNDEFETSLSEEGDELISLARVNKKYQLNRLGKLFSADSMSAVMALGNCSKDEVKLLPLSLVLIPTWIDSADLRARTFIRFID